MAEITRFPDLKRNPPKAYDTSVIKSILIVRSALFILAEVTRDKGVKLTEKGNLGGKPPSLYYSTLGLCGRTRSDTVGSGMEGARHVRYRAVGVALYAASVKFASRFTVQHRNFKNLVFL